MRLGAETRSRGTVFYLALLTPALALPALLLLDVLEKWALGHPRQRRVPLVNRASGLTTLERGSHRTRRTKAVAPPARGSGRRHDDQNIGHGPGFVTPARPDAP